ncbi:beta family protein [Sphingobacterium chungjuense]|uniref:beta family protein n=1 Tax=Sphingobacterium chungjuense TaxID=2675553 RepID=UPI00140C5BE3|nr:hypothetical protein [Sphingobacterium chungjuense]
MMFSPTYVPIFRLRQEEKKVLVSFNFQNEIYPYIEIFKHRERKLTISKRNRSKMEKTFDQEYLPTLERIKSEKIFLDLPVHLKSSRKMTPEVLNFLRGVIEKREERTKYIILLQKLSDKIIPVISTYSQLTAEQNSIISQSNDLRSIYKTLSFRTSSTTFYNDMEQIKKVIEPQDYLFVDLEEYCLSNEDDLYSIEFMLNEIENFKQCHVVYINSPIARSTTNSGLDHGKRLAHADNSLMDIVWGYGGKSFSDYVGIKKDVVESGGAISPGYIMYDAVENSFYGFKGRYKKIEDFEDIIVPAVMNSIPVERMRNTDAEYLSRDNVGWRMLEDIVSGVEKPKSQSKFKRISMEHYLYCIRKKIQDGYFLL